MKSIALWRWQLHSKTTGRTYISHKCMTEAEALARDPLAVRVDWSLVWQSVPEVLEETKSPKREGKDRGS